MAVDVDWQRFASEVRVPGRFERLARDPDTIADVGHNPHAARWLAQQLRRRFPGRRVLAVYGCLQDKDSAGVAEALAATVDGWYLGSLEVPRGLPAQALAERLQAVPAVNGVRVFDGITQALIQARSDAAAEDLVLVFGSFYTVAEARNCLGLTSS